MNRRRELRLYLVRRARSSATTATALAELPGERRAAFCRLEHMVPWAIQGAHWEPGGPTEPSRIGDSLERCAHCGEPLGDVAWCSSGTAASTASRTRFCSVDHLADVGEGGRALAVGRRRLSSGCGERPSSLGHRSSMPAITRARCSSKSTPSSSAPARTSSRSTAAAKLGCLSFFLTDFGVMPWMPVGRTSAQAATNPDSSSTANSVFASGVSRGTPRKSAWPATASISSSG